MIIVDKIYFVIIKSILDRFIPLRFENSGSYKKGKPAKAKQDQYS